MSPANTSALGLSFSGNQVFYAVSTGPGRRLERIGQILFQFPVVQALGSGADAAAPVASALQRLAKDSGCGQVRIVTPPEWEVWTTVPKSVYEDPLERDASLAILGERFAAREREPYWFPLSNREYRFLTLRSTVHARQLEHLVKPVPVTDRISAFECGARWATHSGTKGSFLTLQFYPGQLAAASFILGKLRGATVIPFEAEADLPYLWLHHAQFLHWMRGIHDQALVFGAAAESGYDRIRPYLDAGTVPVAMNSLEKCQIETGDQTYGFDLSEAWPAILAALEV